jgi:RNA polymerase sigma-70 factor (ECF subfamily)
MGIIDEQNIINDPKEFEKFFKEKYRSLCLLACRYVRDMVVAEEIVQDVFVRIWEKRGQIQIKGPAHAYITSSVKNNCLNYLKHKSVVENYEKSEVLRTIYNPGDIEEEMHDMELESAVMVAIAELPPKRQKIFNMSRAEGLKYHEIADQLGLSIKTVEAQMGQALKQLRVKLNEYL